MYFWEVPVVNIVCQTYGVGKLLLHCYASNLLLEILKHDKMWGNNLH